LQNKLQNSERKGPRYLDDYFKKESTAIATFDDHNNALSELKSNPADKFRSSKWQFRKSLGS